jgi:hypothetical protein
MMVLDYVEPICNAPPSCKDKMLLASKTKKPATAGAVESVLTRARSGITGICKAPSCRQRPTFVALQPLH